MRWKTTVLLLALTIGIGAYVSLYELKQPSPEMRQDLANRVLNVNSDDIRRIAVHGPQADAVLVRAGAAWQLETPPGRADGALADSLVNETAWLTAERTLSGTPAQPLDPKMYGLDPPSARLAVTTQDGQNIALLFGEQTAVGSSRYLKRVDRPDIFVVASSLYERLDQPIETFRDPLLVRFNSWETTELTVNAPAHRFVLARSGNDWTLTQPFADRADRTEVGVLLGRASDLRIQRFINDAPGEGSLSTWGLDQPTMELALVQPEPTGRIALLFGSAVSDDQTLVYAKRSDEPSIYAVLAKDVEALRADPHGLRAKACFDFFTSHVTKVEGRRGDTAWVAERNDDTWQEPASGKPLDPQRVEDFLKTLADLRLSGFVEDAPADLTRFGLEPPSGVITVWTTGRAEPQRLSIGGILPDSTNRYGRIEGRSAVVRLPESATQLLDTTIEQLVLPTAAEAAPSVVDAP